MKHFNAAVSIELQSKLKDFSEAALADFISEFNESSNRAEVDELSGIAESGWIPLQLGGFTIYEFYRNDLDPSFHFTKAQTAFNEKYYEGEAEYYKSENGLTEIDYEDNDVQQWECDLFEDALLSLNAYVDNGGLVQLELTLNYKDAPYYRSNFSDVLKKMTFTEEEFMVADFDEIFEQLNNYEE